MSNKFPCHPSRWGLLTGVLLLLSSVLPLASIVLGNAGMLALRDGLMAQGDFVPGDYPFYVSSQKMRAGHGTHQKSTTN